nr:ABC transporter substrate-binding protein [Clostridiales bacterium]
MEMKKLLAIILILSMVACFSACGGGSADGGGSQTATDVLYHSYGLQPYVTLDPRSENSNGVMVLNNVYETLTYYNDQTGEVEPLLATSWEEKDEGLTWVFQVRDDVTFHDGTPMTAQNVANSINATIEMGMGASYIWDAVESVEATGDYEVTFKLSYAAPIDIIASAAYAAFVVSDA